MFLPWHDSLWQSVAAVCVSSLDYKWLIIATIKIGGNVVQVLATLTLLSFIKMFRTAVLAIKFKTLGCVNGNANTSDSTVVWYMDGNIPY